MIVIDLFETGPPCRNGAFLRTFGPTKYIRTNPICIWLLVSQPNGFKSRKPQKNKARVWLKNSPLQKWQDRWSYDLRCKWKFWKLLHCFWAIPDNSAQSKASIRESLLLGIASGAQQKCRKNSVVVCPTPGLVAFPHLGKITPKNCKGEGNQTLLENYQLD